MSQKTVGISFFTERFVWYFIFYIHELLFWLRLYVEKTFGLCVNLFLTQANFHVHVTYFSQRFDNRRLLNLSASIFVFLYEPIPNNTELKFIWEKSEKMAYIYIYIYMKEIYGSS